MPVALSLEGKVALITGGSRGIGAATVRLFVAAGASVVFNYHRAAESAEKLVSECGSENCHAVQAELNSALSAKPLVDAAIKRYGAIDILIANHGVWPPEDIPIDQMEEPQ